MPTIQDARKRLALDPSDVDALFQFVKRLRDGADYPDGNTALRRVSFVRPIDPRLLEFSIVLNIMGKVAPVNGWRAAARCAVALPSSYIAHLYAGVLLRDRDRPRAERLLARAIAIDPNDSRAREQLWKVQANWGWQGQGTVGTFHVPKGSKDADPRFFRSQNARFFPRMLADLDDIDAVLRRDIFHGYLPEQPLIATDKPVVALGSCFAQHIRQWLMKRGRLSEHVEIPEGLNNTFAIRQFLDWIEGADDLVYSIERGPGGRLERWDLDKDRDAFRQAISRAGGFVVTIGVAEVWRDKITGGVFWRGVPADQFDPDRHEHLLSTVEQNVENLRAIAAGLRRLSDGAPVVLTLSPVPLIATMRPNTSIFAADAVSKSTLRLAIETVVSAGDGVKYWPSFEAFRWLGGHVERRLYDGEANPRHPSPDMIGRIIDLFVDSYFEPSS